MDDELRTLMGADAYQIDILQCTAPATYWKSLARKLEDPSVTKRPAAIKQPSR